MRTMAAHYHWTEVGLAPGAEVEMAVAPCTVGSVHTLGLERTLSVDVERSR